MPSEPLALTGRLHPFSWLFVLITQLKPVVVPLLLLLFLGQGEWWELMGAVGAGVLALYSLVYSLGFRYELGRDELVVREGLLDRTERHIPYARIQNIVQKRNPLHRVFGVTELRLESAGGIKPEAVMNVITVAEAARIAAVLRTQGQADGVQAGLADESEAPPRVALTTTEIVKLGLATNRGWIAVGAFMAFAAQAGWWENDQIRNVLREVFMTLGSAGGFAAGLVGTVLAVLGFLLGVKLLSLLMALVSFHGFTLRTHGDRLATEGGLLTRHHASARLDKIQRYLIGESPIARALNRRFLSCEVAAGIKAVNEDDGARLKWLAPIAAPDAVETLLEELAPGHALERRAWRGLHRGAAARRAAATARWTSIPGLIATLSFGLEGVGLWTVLVLLAILEARGWARFAAYALDAEIFAFREGWLTRQWIVTRISKGQTVEVFESPFDRRRGMAAVELDTAGASPMGGRLRVPYLAADEARRVAQFLRARL